MAKLGRPSIGDNGKRKRYTMRMTEDEMKHLDDLSIKFNKNKCDIIREALKLYEEYGGDINGCKKEV